jgi:hypothetical protein
LGLLIAYNPPDTPPTPVPTVNLWQTHVAETPPPDYLFDILTVHDLEYEDEVV